MFIIIFTILLGGHRFLLSKTFVFEEIESFSDNITFSFIVAS